MVRFNFVVAFLMFVFPGIEPIEKQREIRDWLQNVGLRGDEDYILDPDINCIRMGLGWDRYTLEPSPSHALILLMVRQGCGC